MVALFKVSFKCYKLCKFANLSENIKIYLSYMPTPNIFACRRLGLIPIIVLSCSANLPFYRNVGCRPESHLKVPTQFRRSLEGPSLDCASPLFTLLQTLFELKNATPIRRGLHRGAAINPKGGTNLHFWLFGRVNNTPLISTRGDSCILDLLWEFTTRKLFQEDYYFFIFLQ